MFSKSVIGPFAPSNKSNIIFCMAGDEATIFAPPERLNSRQSGHVKLIKEMAVSFAMNMIPISKRGDTIILDGRFAGERKFFDWHIEMYRKMGLEFGDNFIFANQERFYESVGQIEKPTDTISIETFSHEQNKYFPVKGFLKAVALANSKIHLAASAADYDITIPRSLVISKIDIMNSLLPAEVMKSPNKYYIKADGLGGGYNISKISCIDDIFYFITPFSDDDLFVIQEDIDSDEATHISFDLIIKNDKTELLGIKEQMLFSGQYSGNIFNRIDAGGAVSDIIPAVSGFLRDSGYSSELGFIAGVDAVIKKDRFSVIEINARWTGGLPAFLLLKKIGLPKNIQAAYIFDKISEGEINNYRKFVEKYLWTPVSVIASLPQVARNDNFQFIPFAFSPVKKNGFYWIDLIVAGNFLEFVKVKRKTFGQDSFPMSERLSEKYFQQ